MSDSFRTIEKNLGISGAICIGAWQPYMRGGDDPRGGASPLVSVVAMSLGDHAVQ